MVVHFSFTAQKWRKMCSIAHIGTPNIYNVQAADSFRRRSNALVLHSRPL